MALTAADVLIETIQDWGVEVVFGLPVDVINGVMEALMACGCAKFTGKLGVCLATSGPGGIHLLNGLYDAALDGQPVLAITGMAYHDQNPADCGRMLEEALEPPLPAKSLLRGEPNSQKIALTVLGDRIRELV
jgi:thiamine pyrophosphate-dependent acetolactate synthase large subunit-like protein